MKTISNNSKLLLAIGLIVAAVIFRIIPHPFNMTPLIAIVLFAGAKFENKKLAFIIPMLTLFLSDVIISYMNNYPLLHSTILFTYGTVWLIVLLGTVLKGKFNIGKTAGITLLASLLFFVISNFGVWLFSNMYTLNLEGLINCYVMAIPFNKFSWAGDLIFSFALFGIYEIVSNRILAEKTQFIMKK